MLTNTPAISALRIKVNWSASITIRVTLFAQVYEATP